MPMPQNSPGDDITAAEWNQLADAIDTLDAAALKGFGVHTTRHDITNNQSRVHPLILGPYRGSIGTTPSMSAGQYLLGLALVKGTTPLNLGVTATGSPASGDDFHAVVYNIDPDTMMPTTLQASWKFDVDTTGGKTITGQTETTTDGLAWVGGFCPTGNTGTIIINPGFQSAFLLPAASNTLNRLGSIQSGDSGHTTPGDLSAFTLGSSSAATKFGYGASDNNRAPFPYTYGTS